MDDINACLPKSALKLKKQGHVGHRAVIPAADFDLHNIFFLWSLTLVNSWC